MNKFKESAITGNVTATNSYSHASQALVKITSISLLLATLVACGESDLEVLQQDAIVAAQEANQAAATAADNTEEGTGDTVDTGANTENNTGDNTVTDVPAPLPQTPASALPATAEAERNQVDLSGYQLVFNENFDSTALNSSKWNTAYRWGADLVVNSEEQYYIDNQNNPDFGYNPFRFGGEVMAIGANRTPAELAASANNQPFISGVLTTAGKFSFTYGYAEMRAQVPSGSGLWPQFWMLPEEFVGRKPQVYIAEMRGSDPSSLYHSYKWQNENDDLLASDLYKTNGTDFSTEFHTYGVQWSEGKLVFYVDGYEYHRLESENVSDQDMYLIVNLAVGGWFVGSPDEDTPFPAEMVIDHVRVYQLID